MNKTNGQTPPDSTTPDQLIHILNTLDAKQFREITGSSIDDTTDDEILEAMHITRSEMKGIDRKKQLDSKRWLYRKAH